MKKIYKSPEVDILAFNSEKIMVGIDGSNFPATTSKGVYGNAVSVNSLP